MPTKPVEPTGTVGPESVILRVLCVLVVRPVAHFHGRCLTIFTFMGMFDSLRSSLTELPISDIVRARLELALDQLSDAQSKVSDLQTQVARLEAQLEREHLDHKQTKEELERLKDEHSEDIRIHRLIEFRRGLRTGGVWMPFCPSCHLPIDELRHDGTHRAYCSANDCEWGPVDLDRPIDALSREIGDV